MTLFMASLREHHLDLQMAHHHRIVPGSSKLGEYHLGMEDRDDQVEFMAWARGRSQSSEICLKKQSQAPALSRGETRQTQKTLVQYRTCWSGGGIVAGSVQPCSATVRQPGCNIEVGNSAQLPVIKIQSCPVSCGTLVIGSGQFQVYALIRKTKIRLTQGNKKHVYAYEPEDNSIKGMPNTTNHALYLC